MENNIEQVEEKDNKKNNFKVVIVIFVIAVLGVFAVYINKDFLFGSENDSSKIEESNNDDESVVDIDDEEDSDEEDDSKLRIYSLDELNENRSFDSGIYYDETADDYSKYYDFYNTYYEKIYKDGSLSVSEMTDKMKFFFLSDITNIFSLSTSIDDDEDGLASSSIAESDLKDAYEMMYGENTYKQLNSVTLLCYPFTYDSTNKVYSTTWSGCDGGDRNGSVLTRVVDYQESTDKLTITTSVLYYSYDKGEYYKDYDMTLKISDSNFSESMSITDIQEYIQDNYSSLEQYTYTFKIVDGNYIYQGVTRTKSVK